MKKPQERFCSYRKDKKTGKLVGVKKATVSKEEANAIAKEEAKKEAVKGGKK